MKAETTTKTTKTRPASAPYLSHFTSFMSASFGSASAAPPESWSAGGFLQSS
jgi:hypothetical protein